MTESELLERIAAKPSILGRRRPYGRLVAQAVFLGLAAATTVLGAPFVVRDELPWAEMGPMLLAGTVALAAATLVHARATASLRDGLVFVALACGVGLAAEYAGVRWAIPFGYTYQYHADLRPRLFGCVPLFIPIAWAVLAYTPVVFLRAFETRRAFSLSLSGRGRGEGTVVEAADHVRPSPYPLPEGERGARRLRRVVVKAVLAAVLLTAMDLYLDPLAVAVGAWTWHGGGAYFGVPLRNFAGWFVVGMLVYVPFFLLERRRPAADRRAFDRVFVAVSAAFQALALVAAAQRVGHPLPVALGAGLMAPYVAWWSARRRVRRPTPQAVVEPGEAA